MIHIRTLRDWKYNEDPDGNAVRVLPRGRTFSLDNHLGILAIAQGAAEAVVDLDEAQAFALDCQRAVEARDEARLQQLLGETTDAGGETPDDAAPKKPTKRSR